MSESSSYPVLDNRSEPSPNILAMALRRVANQFRKCMRRRTPLLPINWPNTQGANRPRSMPHSSPQSPSKPPAVAPGPDHRQEDRRDTFARDYAEQIETIARTQYA